MQTSHIDRKQFHRYAFLNHSHVLINVISLVLYRNTRLYLRSDNIEQLNVSKHPPCHRGGGNTARGGVSHPTWHRAGGGGNASIRRRRPLTPNLRYICKLYVFNSVQHESCYVECSVSQHTNVLCTARHNFCKRSMHVGGRGGISLGNDELLDLLHDRTEDNPGPSNPTLCYTCNVSWFNSVQIHTTRDTWNVMQVSIFRSSV